MLRATLLTVESIVLRHVPDITDVRKLPGFVCELGSSVGMDFASGTLKLRHGSRLDASGARLWASIEGRSTIQNVLPIHRVRPGFGDNLNAPGAQLKGAAGARMPAPAPVRTLRHAAGSCIETP